MLLSAISLAANGEARMVTEMLTTRSRSGSRCSSQLRSTYIPLSYPVTTCHVHGDEASEVYPWPLWRGLVYTCGIYGRVWLTSGRQSAHFRNVLGETLLACHVSSYRDLLLTVSLGVSDLTPNVGMWWYFVTEMFDHFRPFFVGVFHVSTCLLATIIDVQLHNVLYVAPVCLRMKHDPVLAMVIITGIFSAWKSYPALGDLAIWAGLLGCFPEVISSESPEIPGRPELTLDLRHPLFTLTVYLYTLLLLPILHSLWLLTGTGNANFFYAATMVHGLNSSLAIVDFVGASIRSQIKASVRAESATAPLTGTGVPLDLEGDEWQIIQLNKVD
jgi:hypothetical protein